MAASVDIPTTTYETDCWSDGGDDNGTTCTSVPITTYYTVCDGGGGGGGGGGNYPPSGGGGGSPTPSPSPQPDPCSVAQPAATNATNIAKTSGYSSGLAAVQSAAKDGNEHAVTLNKNSSGVINATSVSNGGESSSSTPISASTVATLHNHPNNTPPSAGDVYSLISGNQKYSANTTKYVTLPNGDIYALVITNLTAATNFATKYPSQQTGNYPPDFPEDLANEFSLCSSTFTSSNNYSQENANAAALALILDKYNAGVALLQQSDGSFTKLGTTSSGSGGSETFKQNNCPTP